MHVPQPAAYCCALIHPGAHRPLGLDGWRFAFVSLAAVSAATGAANLLYTEDPLRQQQQQHASGKAGRSQAGAAASEAPAPQTGPWEEGAAGDRDSERQPLRWGGAREGGSPRQRPAAAGKQDLAAAESSPARSHDSSEPSCQAAPGLQLNGGSSDGRAPPLGAQWRRIGAEVLAVLRVPTFVLIVVQASRGLFMH